MTTDPVLTENAISVLRARYLIKDAQGNVVETPRQLFERVALAIAEPEPADKRAEVAEDFYALMARRAFLPNTPCLVNAGRNGGTGQLSACFVIPVPDSMAGIFEAVKQMALVHKTGGGTGFSFSRLRPAGSAVGTTSGVASGPVSFMIPFDSTTQVTKQGGVRRGANMGVLRVDHPDIMQFIRMKLDPSVLQNFNVSVGITDAFMTALAANQEYDLVDPSTQRTVRSMLAREVWDEIIRCAHTIGDPGLVFLDRVNALDPLSDSLGVIEATNPCGEVPLRAHDACTLGSVNLSNFVSGTGFDLTGLRSAVSLAVRFLDNVLSACRYPVQEIYDVTRASRKIGLGVMGWADALIKLGIPYDSLLARELGADVMRMISDHAVQASVHLATERGPFEAWPVSKWAKQGRPPRRNATCTVIAPTGTISIIAGCSSGIEPLYALSMTRNQAGMIMTEVNPLVRELAEREGFASPALDDLVQTTGSIADAMWVPENWRAVLVTANEISMPGHVLMQAAFQRYTEDGVSKTVNLRRTATVDDVRAAYELAWENGCKGITVYRDGCREGQVLVAGTTAPGPAAAAAVTPAVVEAVAELAAVRRIPADGRRQGITISRATPYGTAHVTINVHPSDGKPFEVFARLGKGGSEANAWTEALGRTISYVLSNPSSVPVDARLDAIAQQLAGIGGGSALGLGAEQVVSAPDAIAKVLLDYLYGGEGAPTAVAPERQVRRDICPSCGHATLTYSAKCGECHNCGFSKC